MYAFLIKKNFFFVSNSIILCNVCVMINFIHGNTIKTDNLSIFRTQKPSKTTPIFISIDSNELYDFDQDT